MDEKNNDVVTVDGDFLDEMRQIEREVLAEIDPEALEKLERDDR